MIDGSHFPMEMHLVHYKESYGSFDEAVDKPDGLVAIGTTYRVSMSSIKTLINSRLNSNQ
jgi:carbonic anhydrase